MIDEEYKTKFLELLRYISYLKYQEPKVQKKLCGFPLEFHDRIEYDDPKSPEEFIGKLNHYYEQSMSNNEYQKGWKWKDKGKGKQQTKITRNQNAQEKKNLEPYKKFDVVIQGHESQQHHNGDGT